MGFFYYIGITCYLCIDTELRSSEVARIWGCRRNGWETYGLWQSHLVIISLWQYLKVHCGETDCMNCSRTSTKTVTSLWSRFSNSGNMWLGFANLATGRTERWVKSECDTYWPGGRNAVHICPPFIKRSEWGSAFRSSLVPAWILCSTENLPGIWSSCFFCMKKGLALISKWQEHCFTFWSIKPQSWKRSGWKGSQSLSIRNEDITFWVFF